MTLRRYLAALVLALLAAPGSRSPQRTPRPTSRSPHRTSHSPGDSATWPSSTARRRRWSGSGRRCRRGRGAVPLRVRITEAGAGGATTFTFGSNGGRGVVNSQEMEIHGPVRQLLNSVLPHEMTHTVFAYHFGRPVPRWADEGGSVLSENDEERTSHDIRCREILNQGKAFRLNVLFRMVDYPRDMIVLYAEGYSVSAYLVERGGGGREGRGSCSSSSEWECRAAPSNRTARSKAGTPLPSVSSTWTARMHWKPSGSRT